MDCALTDDVSRRYADVCETREAAFIEVHAALRDSGAFLASMEPDGYHPDAEGYRLSTERSRRHDRVDAPGRARGGTSSRTRSTTCFQSSSR